MPHHASTLSARRALWRQLHLKRCLRVTALLVVFVLVGCPEREQEPAVNPASQHGDYTEALHYVEQENWQAAEQAIQAQLQAAHHLIEGRNLLGYVLSRQGRYEEAREAFALNSQAEPANPEHRYNQAAVLRRMGNAAAAMAMLIEVTRQDPDNILYGYNLRLALIETGQDEGLDVRAMSELERDPPRGDWLMTAAAIALKRGYFDEAAQLLQAARRVIDLPLYEQLVRDVFFEAYAAHPQVAAAMQPLNRPATTSLLAALQAMQQGDLEESLQLADEALAEGESPAAVYTLQAMVYMRRDQPRQARDLFARAAEHDPDQSAAWFNLAQAQRALGQSEQAMASYERALQLSADHPVLPVKLALTRLEAGMSPQDAMQALSGRSPAVEPSVQAAILLQEGRVEQAAEVVLAMRVTLPAAIVQLVVDDSFFNRYRDEPAWQALIQQLHIDPSDHALP